MQPRRQVGAELAITGNGAEGVEPDPQHDHLTFATLQAGDTVAVMNADLRGNTDKSWSRTLDWLVRNRLLARDGGVAQ